MRFSRPLAMAGVVVSGLSVAACQSAPSTGNTAVQGFSSPTASETANTPVIMPAVDPIGRSTSSSKSKSWTSADGTRHTKTTTSSAGFSVDPNAAGALVAGLLGGNSNSAGTSGASASNAASYVGKWNLSASNQNCSLTLNKPIAGSASASAFGCFGTNLNRVTTWSLRGYDVVLTGFGETYATLRVTQPNRMDGNLAGGGTITAWR
ncbi:AprI/Inh family metalloprotease inhibitor [Roseibium sp. SCP14]|uniref:AprI/Inh family metalloprotease inhibitor n=1 Tax=Roseibium sp. SCP14 TaxID=3141375 RepID=UPI003338AE78